MSTFFMFIFFCHIICRHYFLLKSFLELDAADWTTLKMNLSQHL